MSPPSTFRSRSTSKLLLTLVVPVAAPISIAVPAVAMFAVVAAPKALIVVALVLRRLNVAWFVVMSPPSIFRSLSISTLPVLNVISSEPFVVSTAIYSEVPSFTKKAFVTLSSTTTFTLVRLLPRVVSSALSVVSISR